MPGTDADDKQFKTKKTQEEVQFLGCGNLSSNEYNLIFENVNSNDSVLVFEHTPSLNKLDWTFVNVGNK